MILIWFYYEFNRRGKTGVRSLKTGIVKKLQTSGLRPRTSTILSIRTIVISFLLIGLISLTSCHEYYYDSGYPCDFCYTGEQTEGVLTIKLTPNDENPKIPIVIYINEIDNNEIEYIDTTSETNYEIWVPIDNYYSVTAEYKLGDKTITAVDGAKVYKKKNTTDCDDDCWIVFDGTVDVSLKYDD